MKRIDRNFLKLNIRFILILTSLFGVNHSLAQQANDGMFKKDILCEKNVNFEEMTRLKLPIKKSEPVGPFYDTNSNIVYIFPPNGPNFPANASNCDFFSWAGQMFLWSTSTIDDIQQLTVKKNGPTKSTPYVFNSEFFYRLEGDKLVAQKENKKNPASAVFRASLDKPTDGADGVGQAGGNNVLTFTGADGKPAIVYYGVHTNRVFGYVVAANLSAKDKAGKAQPPFHQFPSSKEEVCQAIAYGSTHGYTEKSPISNSLQDLFCPDKNKLKALINDIKDVLALLKCKNNEACETNIIPKLEPAIDYLTMTVELKTSWVKVADLPQGQQNNYIIQQGTIPTYTKSGKTWKRKGTTSTELALVGMHIVGTVAGHPEMIWATIEHKNNTPDAAYYYFDEGNKQLKQSTSTLKESLFYKEKNKQINQAAATQCANNICSTGNDNIESINVIRAHPWGVNPDASDSSIQESAKIATQLLSINKQLFGSLIDYNEKVGEKKIKINDPRENYFIVGANWTKNGVIPTAFKPTGEGSPYLANATMETFHQQSGCFSCHSAEVNRDNLSISHIFHKVQTVEGKKIQIRSDYKEILFLPGVKTPGIFY